MSALPALEASEFSSFFIALNGVDPFPWQQRLLDDLVAGKWLDAKINPQQWPAAMALPTASGKTACMDIALFHLALQADVAADQRTAARRIFFCVDRRVTVDEACDRALRIAAKLACAVGQRACDDCRDGAGGSKCAQNDALRSVAARLRHLAGGDGTAPLAVFQLRGGMYRDDAWATSPLQPTVVCTTVDQLGSRLLFRGYGVSPRSVSIHAGLAANDALILLDEAHCAEPFRQTLEAVRLFRDEKWAEQPLRSPFAFVEMSATPRSDAEPFVLNGEDREHAELKQRLSATKPARLVESQCKTATDEFAQELAALAEQLASQGSRRIAVMVNRVDTAKAVFEKLGAPTGDPADEELAGRSLKALMIGRMRPLDRDELTRRWQPYLRVSTDRAERPAAGDDQRRPLFVVATQCLEVGANLDFDALITEAASLDALRQRFGRLNRLGNDPNCSAAIVARKDSIALTKGDDRGDPIYGPAIAKTWEWLEKCTEITVADAAPTVAPSGRKKKKSAAAATKTIDFGINAIEANLPTNADERAELLKTLSPPAPDAPVMLPAHLDLWCQTAPIPDPDPDVSIFLHGPQRGVPTVSVCWRADLGDDSKKWAEIVSLLPPSSPECMPAPLHLVRKWIKHEPAKPTDDTGDVEQAAQGDDRQGNNGAPRYVLRWRGKPRERESETCPTNDPNDLRPGDVVVIPAALAHTCSFGHLPGIPNEWTQQRGGDKENEELRQPLPDSIATPLDRGEQANFSARRTLALRLTPQFVASWPDPRDDETRPVIPARCELLSLLQNPETRERLGDPDVAGQLKATLRDLSRQLKDGSKAKGVDIEWASLRVLIAATTTRTLRADVVEHPAGGLVVRSRRRIGERALRAAGLAPGEVEAGFGDENESSFGTSEPISLGAHLSAVATRAWTFADGCGLSTVADPITRAAELHDHGKLDPRFQAVLFGVGPRGLNGRPPLAKSGRSPTAGQARADACRAELPAGYRHEMLSLQIAENARSTDGKPLLDGLPDVLRELVLHLIASHHGHARPFAPVVINEKPPKLPAFEWNSKRLASGENLVLPAIDERRRAEWEQRPAHRLDSGVCDRFWTLTRRYGWWGLAYLEAILRLADRAVSRKEQEGA